MAKVNFNFNSTTKLNNPLISIIIVTYNAANTIERALESVRHQSIHVELLIVDGDSTDETTAIVKRFADIISLFISEPDAGIYDAMNKAIDHAHGQWLYFLGADDVLQAGVLATISKYLDNSFTVVFGDVLFNTGARMKSYLGPMTLLQNTIHHQSAFYHRSLFDAFRYDVRLRTIADYELNLLIYLRKLPVRCINFTVAICQAGGASSDWALTIKETNIIRKRYLSSTLIQKLLSKALYFYYLQKKFRNLLLK